MTENEQVKTGCILLNGCTLNMTIGKHKDMTREHFETNTNWKMSYEEYQRCDCTQCNKKDCIHRNAFRRVPVIDGGLGLCPNLKKV